MGGGEGRRGYAWKTFFETGIIQTGQPGRYGAKDVRDAVQRFMKAPAQTGVQVGGPGRDPETKPHRFHCCVTVL